VTSRCKPWVQISVPQNKKKSPCVCCAGLGWAGHIIQHWYPALPQGRAACFSQVPGASATPVLPSSENV
jgi:hypothetical protein